MPKIIKQKNRGFAIIYAIIIATVVVLVISSVVSIGLRQSSLTAISTESQNVLYAAGTGIECALYWDNHTVQSGRHVFPYTGQIGGKNINQQPVSKNKDEVKCGGASIFDIKGDDKKGIYKYHRIGNSTLFSTKTYGGICVNVQVIKSRMVRDGEDYLSVEIRSEAFDTCDKRDSNTIYAQLRAIYSVVPSDDEE